MAKGRKTLDLVVLDKQEATIRAGIASGSISKIEGEARLAGILATRQLMASMETREVGSTRESLKEYTKGLSTSLQSEAEKIADSLDAGVDRLREILKDVRIERDGESCKVLPRYFLNTPKVSGKATAAVVPAAVVPAAVKTKVTTKA